MATSGVPSESLGLAVAGEAPLPPPWNKAQPHLVCAVVLVVVAWCAARAAEWAWLRPRRLGRALRAQGLRGTAYRPISGDAALADRLAREARSRLPRAMPLFHHAMEEHGKTSVTWSGPVPSATIADPALVRQVLSNKFGHFERVGFGQLQRLLHNGVSTHQGAKWARHRRIINPAFHLDKLKRMLPAFASCCADLVSRWEGLAAAGAGEAFEVDVWPEMQSLTGDVISRAAFGSSYLEGRRIYQLQEEQVRLVKLVANKINIPGYIMMPTRINRQIKRIAAEIEGTLRAMIAKREDAMRAGESPGGDLLGQMLQSNSNMEQSGGGISTDDVIGECKMFYFAGRETMSILLTWTMILLSMHPEWQDRAREEVLRVFPAGAAGTAPDYDCLSLLKIVSFHSIPFHFAGAGDDGAVRGVEAVHAAAGDAPADVQAGGARRREVPGGGDAGAAAAVRPPRQGRVGSGRR
ncbi:unnamed protein product [Urochloa humidicola]